MNHLADIAWPLATIVLGGFAFDAVRQWLKRDAQSVKDLTHQLGELERDWTHKFEREKEQNERRLGAIERRLNNEGQGRNPLGSHYDTRRPG